FFSSRRRHTSSKRDWSSDVCSSDLDRVLAKDPSFAPAYGGLVAALATMSVNYAGIPPPEAYARMQPAAAKALELDPLLAEAHVAAGIVHARAREWPQAEESFRRAGELNPN